MALCILLGGTAGPASAQQSITDVLTFLLTNRSIPTGDFVRDEQAAAETSDIVARFLILDVATLPVTSSSGGFTYRLDPSLGTVVRSSDSFGPFFTERSLTAGRRQASLGVGYHSTTFDDIDGRNLRNGTLVSTASILRGETAPFDVETVALRIRTDTMTPDGQCRRQRSSRYRRRNPLPPSEPCKANGSIPIVAASLCRPLALQRPRGSATPWCAPSTTCSVTAGADLR